MSSEQRRASSGAGGGDVWRDASGRSLADYPRPSLAVDVAVLTVVPGPEPRLAVLLQRPSPEEVWRLPGSFVREHERLADAVRRLLDAKCGLADLSPRQLAVLDDPDRDHRGRVVSVAHAASVPHPQLAPVVEERSDALLAAVRAGEEGGARRSGLSLPQGQGRLPYDHDAIVGRAVAELRSRYRAGPDPDGLLPAPFRVSQLQRLHEAVLGEQLQKDTFRRAVLPALRPVADPEPSGAVGRPARLFERA